MPAGRNNLLGIGGQRTKHSKGTLRGAPAKGRRGGGDAQEAKRDLLRRFQERSRNEPARDGGDEAT